MDYNSKKKGGNKGAKSNESAMQEGLRDKENFNSKDMYKPHDKTERMPKGSDRIGGDK